MNLLLLKSEGLKLILVYLGNVLKFKHILSIPGGKITVSCYFSVCCRRDIQILCLQSVHLPDAWNVVIVAIFVQNMVDFKKYFGLTRGSSQGTHLATCERNFLAHGMGFLHPGTRWVLCPGSPPSFMSLSQWIRKQSHVKHFWPFSSNL